MEGCISFPRSEVVEDINKAKSLPDPSEIIVPNLSLIVVCQLTRFPVHSHGRISDITIRNVMACTCSLAGQDVKCTYQDDMIVCQSSSPRYMNIKWHAGAPETRDHQ